MNKIFEQLLKQRGIGEDFLRPRYSDLTDPFVLPGMDRVAERIQQAVNRGEKVLIFGDYDVDGVTASTLMAEALMLAGVEEDNLEIMLPDRFKDGYGMSPRLVDKALECGAKLVITVDTGSSGKEIIEELARAGIDTIVTDHHECGWDLTGVDAEAQMKKARTTGVDAEASEVETKKNGKGKRLEPVQGLIALINPKRPDFPEEYRYLRDLAGVGVAFKVAEALVAKGLIPKGQEKWLLDLVLIGTICDNMPMSRENRILSFYGMKVLAKTRRVGLRELMRKAGVRSLTSDAIGFQLGPRLNAAGRLKSADLALSLVRAKSRAEAAALAEQLEELNQERKKTQQIAVAEIARRLNGQKETEVTKVTKTTEVAEKTRRSNNSVKSGTEPVIIEVGKWHEGVIGIVAGQLVERYHKPAFVLTEVENEVLKGSGRSFGEFDLSKSLEFAKDVIVKGGGHSQAAGVSVEKAKIEDFRAKINEFYRSLNLREQERFWQEKADIEVGDLANLSLELVEEIAQLEPFGEGNTNPTFRLTGVEIVSAARIGAEQNHLRLNVRDKQGRGLKLIAFFAPEEWLELTPEAQVELLVRLEKNEYQGVSSVEGRIVGVEFL